MGGEWKPGDSPVAVVSWQSAGGKHGGTMRALRVATSHETNGWMTETFGLVSDRDVTEVRPLALIDPEDRQQLKRLVFACSLPVAWTVLRDALREFANPTPPKPDEPTGLCAVVEDADGVQWAHHPGLFALPWYAPNHHSRTYAEIAAVRVLSEGVQP